MRRADLISGGSSSSGMRPVVFGTDYLVPGQKSASSAFTAAWICPRRQYKIFRGNAIRLMKLTGQLTSVAS
jgi:hypothetical protein